MQAVVSLSTLLRQRSGVMASVRVPPARDSENKEKTLASPVVPGVKEQMELARAVSRSLSDSSNHMSRGQSMYVNRKKWSVQWVHEGRAQDKMGSGELWATALHAAVLLHHMVLLRGFADIDRVLDSYTDPVIVRLKPFRLLTISGWCFALQLLHVNLALAARWQQWRGDRRQQRRLEDAADICFRGLVLPTCLLVSAVFWWVCSVDREMVYPAVWDAVVPRWLNHGVHSSTAVFALLELLLVRRGGTGSAQHEAAAWWALSVGYAMLMNVVYLLWGTWFYPFLAAVGWPLRLLVQAGVCLAGRALLELAWWLDGKGQLWAKRGTAVDLARGKVE